MNDEEKLAKWNEIIAEIQKVVSEMHPVPHRDGDPVLPMVIRQRPSRAPR